MKPPIREPYAHERELHDGRERRSGHRCNRRNIAQSAANKWHYGNWDGRFEAVESEWPEVRVGRELAETVALSGALPKGPALPGIFARIKSVLIGEAFGIFYDFAATASNVGYTVGLESCKLDLFTLRLIFLG
jgi:hypothetical protein